MFVAGWGAQLAGLSHSLLGSLGGKEHQVNWTLFSRLPVLPRWYLVWFRCVGGQEVGWILPFDGSGPTAMASCLDWIHVFAVLASCCGCQASVLSLHVSLDAVVEDM